jgi:hypothetical protein
VIEGGTSAPSAVGVRRNRLVGYAAQETCSVAGNRRSGVTSKLKGVYPQDPLGSICPENWYYVK